MGGSLSSTPEPDLPALPQQQIVNVIDGQSAPATPGTLSGRVGTAKQARAVKPAFSLLRDSLRLENGDLIVEVAALEPGNAELLAPAAASGEPETWPSLDAARPGAILRRQAVDRGPRQSLRFSGPFDTAAWPVALVLRPGPLAAGSLTLGRLAMGPPDGTLLVFCSCTSGRLQVDRQVLAWGGQGSAFEVKDLFGLQDAQQSVVDENKEGSGANQNCVICLTEPRDTALLPCSHFCVCHACAVSIRLSPARNRCPLCRAEVKDLVKLDLTIPEGAQQEEPQPVEDAEAAPSESAGCLPSTASASSDSSPGLPPRCLQRLSRELKQLEAKRAQVLQEHGLELSLLDPEGGDLRCWRLRLHTSALDVESKLSQELQRWDVEVVELEVWIQNSFPTTPPLARVLRPCFNSGSFFVHDYGALCLEVLTTQGWSPALSLSQLGVQIKAGLQQGQGIIAGSGAMGDAGPLGRQRAAAVAQRIESAHEKDWNAFGTK